MTEMDNNQSSLSGQSCPHFKTCGMIYALQDKLPELIQRFKQNYCHKNHKACSRRWVQDFLGAEKVPELMMPQQYDWAEQLLFESGIRYAAFEKMYQKPRCTPDGKKTL